MFGLFSHKKVVVIVEDDVPLRVFIGDKLAEYDIKTVECGDGNTALQTIAEEHPDCVVLDLMLPGKNGMEILAELREAQPTLPVVILTTLSGEVGLKEEAEKRNALFLNKAEVSIEEVVDAVLRKIETAT
jgi:two-component system response regulator (stage 0 sporulation protein F)